MAANDCTVTDHSDPGARPALSRKMALFCLDSFDEQLENIVSVALAGLAYFDQLCEEAKSDVLQNLLRVIKDEADRTGAVNELRTMIEALPKEASHD